MNVSRLWRHLASTRWQLRRAFPVAVQAEIEALIREIEATHRGQIVFAAEHALEIGPLFRDESARSRALDVFSERRIWDTEHNNGVLIYLLWADRAVEIVADRGIHAKLGSAGWETICREMERHFADGDFRQGVMHGIRAVGSELSRHFPGPGTSNELPDSPLLL